MSKPIRLMIVFVAVMGIVAVARNNIAWTRLLPQPAAPASAPEDVQVSTSNDVPPAAPNDGQASSNGYQGTVQPSGCEGVTIAESGAYSICGVAVVNVELKDDDIQVILTTEPIP